MGTMFVTGFGLPEPEEDLMDYWDDPEYLLDALNQTDVERMWWRDQCEEQEVEIQELRKDRDALARSLEIVREKGDWAETRRPEVSQHWTKHEVATYLGVAPKTVDELVRKGKLDCNQVNSKTRKFTWEQIQRFLRSRTTQKPKLVDAHNRIPVRSHDTRKGGDTRITGEVNRARLREEMDSW